MNTANKKPRSLKQNALYWAAVIPAAMQFLGETNRYKREWSAKESHEEMKERFLSEGIDESTGEIVKLKRPRSTTSLSTAEFKRYIDQIEQLVGAVSTAGSPHTIGRPS